MTRKIFFAFLLLTAFTATAQRRMEALGRGLVALRSTDGEVFISWRLLGTEPTDLAFNLYRTINNKTEKLNKAPLTKGTNYTDDLSDSTSQRTYFVKAITAGKEAESSKPFILKSGTKNYLSIPLQTPAGYTPNDASVGDLDGDGEYEIGLHPAGGGRDRPSNGVTDTTIFQA